MGALSSDTITFDDASYTVKALGVLNGKLILSVVPELTADFVLVVGTDEFASTDASTLEGDSISIIQFQWNDRGLDLPEGEEVAVRVTEPAENTPATGEPTITGTTQVGETLTVDTSAIADEDGLDKRFLQLPVDCQRRNHRGGHRGCNGLGLHAAGQRRRQDHQGEGVLHRRRR